MKVEIDFSEKTIELKERVAVLDLIDLIAKLQIDSEWSIKPGEKKEDNFYSIIYPTAYPPFSPYNPVSPTINPYHWKITM